ncbi:MAG: hypothetical protein KAH01_00315 [Caldisericia bacterium]|nr:hypothetical protein [Caldisericia bacterium]
MALKQQLELPVPKRITADAVVKASKGIVWAIQLNGGTDASSLKLYNHASSATGTQLIEVVATCTTSTTSGQDVTFVDYSALGGIPFSTGIFVDWTGTAAVGYIWYS